jgi:pyruvate dehydrogenase E2 component (dihydrolipoamide acetyltransferase)
VDWTTLKGSGRTGRIVERDVRQAAALAQIAVARAGETLPGEARVSPVARRVAQELGVDLAQLAAQMPGKRIERADVEAAVKQAAPVAGVPAAPTLATRSVPITPVRRMTAERMASSAHTTAPVTLTTEVDATELVRLRNQLKGDGAQVVPSYTDLLGKLVAQALMEHPQVNARFEGESIVQSATVNMGIAVDTERGLLVPVVRDAQAKSLRQIAQESATLIERAKSGRISQDELHGGTFTITNLGMFEIDAFTPIINLPECAILGVGRIVPKQVVVDVEAERVAIRHMLALSLTFDHRLVDGAPAARFLQRVKQYIEKPYLWLVN